jgi:hypothetical protein
VTGSIRIRQSFKFGANGTVLFAVETDDIAADAQAAVDLAARLTRAVEDWGLPRPEGPASEKAVGDGIV